MNDRETIHAKLVKAIMQDEPGEPSVLDLVEGLHAKARNLVALMDDAERNHGLLIGGKTLTAVNELRLELSRWGK